MLLIKTSFLAFLMICIFYKLEGKIQLPIQKVFDKKYITAKALCKGGLELNYSISNLLKDSLVLIIPAGWRFNSNDKKNDYQDILIAHEEILVLKPKEIKTFSIKGYCCEATKAGPQAGIVYTVGKMADSSLAQLARYLNDHPMDRNTEQYSVWAISDRQETANITNNNDSMASILRSFVTKLKGEPLPWYTLLKKSGVSSTGFVSDYPIRFKADIPYTVDKTCYSYCYIMDDKGNKVSQIFGKWLHPKTSDYQANINVTGLKKGNYTLILENESGVLFENFFKM